jgi:hypothetical protein
MNASEQAIPIPAFALEERVDFVVDEWEEELFWEFEEGGLGVLVAEFVDVLVGVLPLSVGVGVGVAEPVLVLLLLLALEAELSISEVEGALLVLRLCTTGAWVCVGLEGETDDVDVEPEPAACMLKTRLWVKSFNVSSKRKMYWPAVVVA